MSKGYVYVLSNPSMPGVFKIGRSKRGGESRAKELYQTGVPEPFAVEFEILIEHHEYVEAYLHEHFKECRVNGGREFFKSPLEEITFELVSAYMECAKIVGITDPEAEALSYLSEKGREVGVEWFDTMLCVKHLEANAIRTAFNKSTENNIADQDT